MEPPSQCSRPDSGTRWSATSAPALGENKHCPQVGNPKCRLLQAAGAGGGWLQRRRRRGERWSPEWLSRGQPARSRRTERLGESVLLRGRRKWQFLPVVTTPLRSGMHRTLAFLRYLCVDIGEEGCRVFSHSCSWVVPSSSSSSAARWRRLLLLLEPGIRSAPHSQGGPSAGEAQTQGVQPSYSRAKFSSRVASLIMYSTCSATLERLVLSGSRPSSFIFTLRHTPTA